MADGTSSSLGSKPVRSKSTLAATYELRRLSRQPLETHEREMLLLSTTTPTTTVAANALLPGDEISLQTGEEEDETEDVFSAALSPRRRTVSATTKNRNTVALNSNTQMKLNLTLNQLLLLPKEDIPFSESGVKLALENKDERLELIVDPVPTNNESSSVWNMLGNEGAKQPTILFATMGYVMDYLIAPHALPNFSSRFTAAKRPSMNISSNMSMLAVDEYVSSSRTIVKDSLAPWVKQLWDSFLLTFKEGISVLNFVQELIKRFEMSVKLDPGGFQNTVQASFETNDGFLVVSNRSNADAVMTRSARAVLLWMGIYQNHRNSSSIRSNTLLLLLHWIKTSSGGVDLAECPSAFALVRKCTSQALEDSSANVVTIAKFLHRELQVISHLCGLKPDKICLCYGMDFKAQIATQREDVDQFRMRELLLCIHGEHSIPKWVQNMTSIFNLNRVDLVASVLTLLVYDLMYRHIQPLMLVTESVRLSSQPVQDMIRVFKVMSFWPLTRICEEGLRFDDAVDRLLFFLHLAESLRRVANFHLFFALMGGLTQPSLSWLWSKVSLHNKVAHKKFEDLKRGISSNGDYRVYRADLSHCQGRSRIPFLGVTTRMLAQLEMNSDLVQLHPQLYHFSRQVNRSAIINDFLGGQRHPYQSSSTTFALSSGPPGPSPYRLQGEVFGSRFAQHPPSNVHEGVFSGQNLGTGLEPRSVRAKMVVDEKKHYVGVVDLPDDPELKLVLCWSISMTEDEAALKESCKEMQNKYLQSMIGGMTNTLMKSGKLNSV